VRQETRDGIVMPASDKHFFGGVKNYQRPIFDLAMTFVSKTDGVAIDAGAHVGIFTRRMAQFAEVLAFEPDADNYACLVENVRQMPWIRPIHAALGDKQGWGYVNIDADHNSGARSFIPNKDGPMRVFTIDDFHGLHVQLIKIDTQGSEFSILKGADMTIRKHHPVLIVEMPDADTTIYLSNLGYRPAARVNKDQIFTWRNS
jgi:FkbM family methyltransferase